MHKVHISMTAAAAYRWTMAHLSHIALIAVAPLALYILADVAERSWLLSAPLRALSGDYSALPSLWLLVAVVTSATLAKAIFIAIMAAQLHGMILFNRATPQFHFGRSERLFVVGAILFALAWISPWLLSNVILLLNGQTVWGVFSGQRGIGATWAGGALSVFLLGGVYLLIIVIAIESVRCLQVFPVAIAERRLSLERSYDLSQGNWWRIAATNVLALLPVAVIAALFIWLLGGFYDLGNMASLRAALQHNLDVVWLTAAVQGVAAMLAGALGAAALSFSYKQLNGWPLNATVGETLYIPPVSRFR